MDEQVLFQKFLETHWGVREMRNKNRSLLLLLLLCRSMKLWNAVHIMSSIGRIA